MEVLGCELTEDGEALSEGLLAIELLHFVQDSVDFVLVGRH